MTATTKKDYIEIATLLRKHFRQVFVLNYVSKLGNKYFGVEVYSPAEAVFDNVLKIKEIVGNDFKVTGNTNLETISIK